MSADHADTERTIRMQVVEETSLIIIRELPVEPREFIFVYRGQPVVEIPRNITRLQVDPSVRIIERDAFKSCWLRNNLTIPPTVKAIENSSFLGCAQLTHVHLQEGLTSIGTGAFLNCFHLVEIQLPTTGLVEIAKATFAMCKSLESVRVPRSVERIGPQAFVNCKSLVEVTFAKDGLLERIELGAFRGCSLLSAISLPPSLEFVGRNVFARCNSLLSVEISSKSNNTIEILSLNDCPSLVNLSIPQNCWELSVLGCPIPEDKHKCLRDRFENLPIHSLCYESSMTTKEQLMRAFNDAANYDESYLLRKDAFDMTPFHILATSTCLKPDILECLLQKYPANILCYKDWYGNTMMDYLLLKHTSPRAIPLVQMVLRHAVINTVSAWYPQSDWGRNLSMLVESIIPNQRRQCVQDFFGHVGHCGRIEITSILELAVWKMKLRNHKERKSMEEVVDRNSFRYQSDGAGIVMEHVVGFLWEAKPTFDTGLSLFPLCCMKFDES